ncbi:MAG: putative lipid II flippase FtsW [Candidatus Magasanikbacteria bacterium]|nr:putative lipid II flippase FtsW [Candidatus Magasanikbacteria bacterium]
MAIDKSKVDYLLLSYFGVLIFFGLILLASASSVVGFERFGDGYFFLKRQILYGFLPGLFLFILLSKIPYTFLKKMSLFIYFVSLVLVILVLIPGMGSSFGTTAQSWIVFGSFSFQPAEIVKLGTIIFFASYLADLGSSIEKFKTGFLTALFLGILPIGLIVFQPDIGTASILFAVIFGMLFLAGAKYSHLGVLLSAGVGAFILMIALVPHRAERLMTFMHPELDPQGIGYHINQAFLAIGSGGWFGFGLGHSRQKFQYLPEVHADSIFAIMAEELGFVIVVAFIILLVAISFRMVKLAKQSHDDFAKFLVFGIMIWFIVQSFFNIGAMVGLVPLTGVPLPFVSHGGTALMISMASVGILINISKNRIKYRL